MSSWFHDVTPGAAAIGLWFQWPSERDVLDHSATLLTNADYLDHSVSEP